MREYGKISPLFWTQGTGKALRKHPEAQIVALYLMTAPLSEMTGVFYCPMFAIAGETGLGDEGASKGLQRLIEVGFCTYDPDSEIVFVHEMAVYQIGEKLSVNDNQVKSVRKAFSAMKGEIKAKFYERYKDAFHLEEERPSEPPSKALRSQEQEQEQEQEQLKPSSAKAEVSGTDVPRPSTPDCPHQEIIALYHEMLPMGTQVRGWTATRAKHLQARWREDQKRQSLDWWRKFFGYVAKSEFLTGRAASRDRDPFVVSLDWLVTSSKFLAVLEGKYHREAA